MMMLLLLAVASPARAGSSNLPCIPIVADHLASTPSAIADHKALRKALGEPMPEAPTMVMMYGRGGHLQTTEYSVILARGAHHTWRGTAVGRTQIWVKDAPYTPMKRIEWELDKDKARRLDDAIAHRCRFDRSAAQANYSSPTAAGSISQRIDVVQPGHAPMTYGAPDGDGTIASIIRPPE